MLIRDLVYLKWLLENLGFLINAKKSVYVPQEIQFLAFQINIQSHNKHTPKGDPLYHNKQWMNIATFTLFLMLMRGRRLYHINMSPSWMFLATETQNGTMFPMPKL